MTLYDAIAQRRDHLNSMNFQLKGAYFSLSSLLYFSYLLFLHLIN